jgi:hypothetical protein
MKVQLLTVEESTWLKTNVSEPFGVEVNVVHSHICQIARRTAVNGYAVPETLVESSNGAVFDRNDTRGRISIQDGDGVVTGPSS